MLVLIDLFLVQVDNTFTIMGRALLMLHHQNPIHLWSLQILRLFKNAQFYFVSGLKLFMH